MTPATYMVSPDTKSSLARFQGATLVVADIAGPATFEPMCRAVGKISVADDMTIGQFIARGFNDELKFAGLYAANGVKLTGTVTKAAFSSSALIVNGYWDLAITLQSSNGQSVAIENRYDFDAGFIGASACNNTSRALGPAVQQLVQKTVNDPRFAALVR
ncbi:MAG TPA: hypothetical protein VH040_09020 [Usitatibacter sp.]|nr:hypothetical protein [Usitatibacter sp.]